MSRRAVWILIGLVVGWAVGAQGQALQIDGGSSAAAAEFFSKVTSGGGFSGGEALRVVVSHIQAKDTVAVYGFGRPQPGFGYGGYFDGGKVGVAAIATDPGSGNRTGVSGEALGGEVNIGLLGDARQGESNYGVFAEAVAPDTQGKFAYGLWAEGICVSNGSNCTKRAVYASGDIEFTGSLVGPSSDLRFKESLAQLEEAVPKLLDLEVVSFEYIKSEEISHLNLPRGPQVGFVAQQVAEVLPELVVESVHPEARDPRDKSFAVEPAEPIRFLSLKPLELIPYLVRAIQEQQAEIEGLKAELQPLRTRLAALAPEVGVEGSPAAAF